MPEFYGELFKSKITRKFHWRLKSSDNGNIVCSSTGGKSRGYVDQKEAARMFTRIFGNTYILMGEG